MSDTTTVTRIRIAILTLSVLGAALFSAAWVTSFVRPTVIETLLRHLLQREIEQRTQSAIAAADGSALAGIARRVVARNVPAIEDARRKLAERLPERVAAVVAEMSDAGCECRNVVAAGIRGYLEGEIATLSRANERLVGFIRTKYMEVAAALLREFRIFTGSNAAVFLLLGATMLFRRGASLQLILPAAVLLVAASLVAFLYLFRQDWLHTVVFADYVGFGYVAYLAVAVAFLADVVLNHARISTEIFNAAANLVGATIQAVPC